ncbi:MAG: hypothetical protein ACRCTZ_04565 [Sarcina sp.]
MGKRRSLVEEVSFKKTEDELELYAWSKIKFHRYGTSEYVKMLLRKEKKQEEDENNK